MEKHAVFNEVYKILAQQVGKDSIVSNTVPSQITNPNGGNLCILPWHEFDRIAFPETEWWISDMIPASSLVLIAAPAGEKKTWVALEMARCIALGIPFVGRFETRKAPVLYIEQESPQYLVQKRGKQLGINEIKEGMYLLSQDALSLNDPHTVDDLFRFVQEHDIKIVFIDTFRSVAGGMKEEKAEEVRAFFSRFKAWKDRGITVVILDHCRKPQKFESAQRPKKEQILGSQDKVAAVEVVHMLHSEIRSEEILFYPIKSKVSREADPFKLLLTFEMRNELEAAVISHGGAIDEKKLKSKEAEELILGYLAEAKKQQTSKQIQEALQGAVGKTAIDDALKEMREQNRIGFKKVGQPFLYWLLEEDDPLEELHNDDLGS